MTSVLQAPLLNRQLQNRITHSLLDIIVLKAIAAEPQCGTDIIRYVKENYGYKVPEAAVYHIIKNYQQNRLIKRTKIVSYARNGTRKIIYTLTSLGQEHYRILQHYSPDQLVFVVHQVFKETTP